MTDEPRRPRSAAQYGPTSAAVAANVRRVRERRGLTIYELSAQLQRAGRAIAPSAVAKIERRERQVSVDDLTALAVVLGVPPSALLLPLDDSPGSMAEITGASVRADVAWDWMDGKKPLGDHGRDSGTVRFEFELYGRPPGRRAALGDVAEVTARLRATGFPIDEWLRETGLAAPSDGE